LFAVSISIPSIFDPLPLNVEPEECIMLPNIDRFSVEETIKIKVFLHQTEYYSELRNICKYQIHYTYFGNETFPDVQEMILTMKIFGAIYEENYSENISLVLVSDWFELAIVLALIINYFISFLNRFIFSF